MSFAAPVVDGTLDAGYGAPKAVQAVGTSFGNNTDPSALTANGSELNAAYGVVEGGILYLQLTGNLQTNFNKLEIFIDSKAGGQNKLRGDNPNVDFNGLNRMGDDGSGNGLRFDTGFESDYYLTYTGGDTGGQIQYFSNFAETNTGGGGAGAFIGGSANNSSLVNGSNGIVLAADQSNILGVNVLGSPNDSDPATVATGMEISIPLSVLGDPTGDIHICAFINGSSHDFVSNQVLGALPSGSNHLGEPRNIDFSQIPGNQYFTVAVPEPASLGLLLTAGLLARRRR
jgi:hypothetical protein